MKNLKLFLLILIMITTLGCKTIEYVPVAIDVELASPPERSELLPREEGVSLSTHLLNRINYYKTLVELWESWGVSVYESIDLEIPESLQSTKIKTEGTNE